MGFANLTQRWQFLQESGPSPDPEQQPIDWFITGLAFLFPALGGALFGYDIGATSGALVSIKSATTSGTDWYAPLSCYYIQTSHSRYWCRRKS